MPRLAPDARRPWRFFSALFRTLRRGRRWETIYAVIILFLRSGIILLFSRNDVAKEFEILRKWTKKMSKIRHRRNTFGKIRRGYIINGPKESFLIYNNSILKFLFEFFKPALFCFVNSLFMFSFGVTHLRLELSLFSGLVSMWSTCILWTGSSLA